MNAADSPRRWTLPMGETAFTIVLTCLAGLGAVATSIYVPSLPDLAQDLATSAAMVQVTLTAFLIAFAVMQLVYGPVSDSYGRKGALLVGLVLFIAGDVVCALSETVEMLIAGRVIQALGACSGAVIARAMVRDVFGAQGAAAAMATIAAGLSLAPAVAPMLGGLIHETAGWRANFLLLGVIGAGLLLVVWRLPETHGADQRMSLSFGSLISSYRHLLGNGRYMGFAVAIALVFGAMFGYIAGSPFLMIRQMGLSPAVFGALIIFNAIGFLCGSLLSRRFEPRLGLVRTLRLGAVLTVLGGGWLLVQAVLAIMTVPGIIVGIAVFLAGVGTIMPVGFAGAIGAAPRLAGAGSGLVGFLHMAAAAGAAWLVAHINDESQIPMMGLIALSGILTLLIGMGLRDERR